MKKLFIFPIILFLLSGCGSDPHKVIIPKDVTEIEKIQPAIDKLNKEDKKIFNRYLKRISSLPPRSNFFDADPKDKEPKSIGQAIEEQKKIDEINEKKRKEDIMKAVYESDRQAYLAEEKIKKNLKSLIDVSVDSKSIISNDDNNTTSLMVSFSFRNTSHETISQLKGRIRILDSFGENISSFYIVNDEPIRPGSFIVWKGKRLIKPGSSNNDVKFVSLDEKKYSVVWEPSLIQFIDGSNFPIKE